MQPAVITRRTLFTGSVAAAAATQFQPAVAEPAREKWVWHRLDWDDVSTRPTIPGIYAVIVKGDSESEGPHVFYDFPDYQALATLTGEDQHDEFDEQRLYGDHDEEAEFMIAWCGPLDLPHFNFDWGKLT
jgi:hypothetical protein